MMLVWPLAVQAQSDTIRYVKTTGKYTNNGRSWATAKNNLQDAINNLRQYLQDNGLSSGSIYVAAGTYTPSESTESEGGGLQFTSFKIYPGIHVYGGFPADITDSNIDAADLADPRGIPFVTEERTVTIDEGEPTEETVTFTDYKYRPHNTFHSVEVDQPAKLQPWNFMHKTILNGSHNSEPSFTFNESKGTFSTIFPGSSYHVVWFATEGLIPIADGKDENDLEGHYLPLSAPASVDGCTITGGYASTKEVGKQVHTAFGGGAYLVKNASLTECVIDHCEATMRGGGVYLDGGGLVDKCMVHTCQSPGVGIMQGYGGGVCIDYDGAVTRSYIVNNSSRIGGGVAICHAPHEYPWNSLDEWRKEKGEEERGEINVYSPHATACIISNNTSTAEGGGIYFYDGGVGNHLTVTQNRCVGQDITYYGRRHGRSGGSYILNGGHIYNSVFWGNKCPANNDIQYAAHTSGSTEDEIDAGTGEVTREGLRPKFFYSAIEKHDITDWAGTTKQNVMSLESDNINPGGNHANYPYFIGSDGRGRLMGYAGAGLNIDLPMGTVDPSYDPTDASSVPDPNATGIPRPIYWKPAAISSMTKKGLQVTDALHLSSEWIRHAHTATDLFDDIYEPMSTFGALVRRDEQMRCALVTNQEIAIYRNKGYTQSQIDDYNDAVLVDAENKTKVLEHQLPDDGTEATLPTIFVDPSRNAGAAHIQIGEQGIGLTWDKPVQNINDAIHYFRLHLKKNGDGTINYDGNGDVTYLIDTDNDGVNEEYHHVQILVKAFERGTGVTATTTGLDSYLGAELRTSSIRPTSNMRIYGGYLPESTGTTTSERNPRSYHTIISGNTSNTGYENNSAHVLALINVRNVIIDGLKLVEGNANLSTESSYAPIDPATGEREAITYGGGIILNNASVPKEERIDMTGNILRNARIANCSAPDGAAIYVNSSNKKANDEYSRAELNVINTVIRNNTVGDGTHNVLQPGYGDAGVVSARGGLALIRLDHCDIVNNCGYALETLEYSDKTGSPAFNAQGINEDEGQIRIYNSVIYANGKVDRGNRKDIVQPLSCRSASNSLNNVDGDYIFLDWDAPKPKNPAHCNSVLCRDMSEQYQKWAIRKMDINQQTILNGTTPEVYYFETEDAANAYIAAHPSSGDWTWCKIQDPNDPSQQIEGPILLDYPFFENPSKNVGHSTEGDKPMNGGVISYMPQNKNPMVNAAVNSSRDLWDSDGFKRTYGGDPDIGAIEGRSLPQAGTVIYVTPEGAGRRDGSSWGNAIQGNAIYALAGGAAGSDALDAQNGARITNDDPAIGTLPGNGVPTTDKRYSGGFGRVWVTDWKTGGSTTTTVTKTWLTEKKVYDDGVRVGEEDILNDGSTPIEETNIVTNNAGSTAPEFTTAGYYNDSNFPYGEISGASRSFWRANPYHNGSDWNNASAYPAEKDGGLPLFIADCNANGWICNTRAENYVGGLQYAVETAAAYNAPGSTLPRQEGVDSIQVWVGNGTYNDYKGFVMRDNTTVMGGFPVDAYGTPGLDERQALMSAKVNIPKSKQAQDFDPEDYETILQISDVDPKQDNDHLNTDAVKFWDDDYALLDRSDTKTTEYKDRTIIHHYKWGTAEGTEATSDYLTYPNFNSVSFTPTPSDEGGYRNYTFGAAVQGKDIWHLRHPIKDNYIVNIENGGNNKNKSRAIYDPVTNQRLKDGDGNNLSYVGNWIFLGNGSMTETEFWQTMPNVAAGKYRLYVDMAGGYRNKFSATEPTNIFFKIIAADGTTELITPVMLKTIGSYNGDDNGGNNRNMAYRYALDFEQPATGNVTIKIVIEDGVRNTTANNATYGTPTGGDPDPIPCSYRYDGANCTGNQWGSNNPNRREFWMSNLHLFPITDGYEEDMSNLYDYEEERQPSMTINETGTLYTRGTHRTTLRKRVLTMPDVCVPTYGAGSVGDPTATDRGKFSDNLSHTDRVVKTSRTSTTRTKESDPNYVEYTDVIWDGFTIRHGFISEEAMAHGGGAGVNMYEGASLRNCVIINNITCCERVKGSGIFCDGSNSSIEGCFVLSNTSTHGKIASDADQKQVFAGGMFMYEGTCFNSLFANNYSHGSAGGVGFCVGRFFNNTIAYNDCALEEGGHKNGGAISIATSSNPNLFIANTIIYGNTGMAIRERYDATININAVNPFINCYVQNEVAFTQDIYKKNINNYSTSGNYGIGNTLLDGVAPSAANTPFAADLDDEGNYTGNAGTLNDFRLTLDNDFCINTGTEHFAGSLKDVLKRKRNWDDAKVESEFIYQNVAAVELPINDVVYADRVQDCQIDIGAYEFDGTQEIKPGYELIAFDPERPDVRELCAVYYVNSGGGGLATGQTPADAACQMKLQHILDAAGRLKKDIATIKAGTTLTDANRYSTQNVDLSGPVTATYEEIYLEGGVKEVRQQTTTDNAITDVKHVIVKLAEGTYYPVRSTNQKMVTGAAEEVLPTRAITIPHGVEVMGGYLDYGDDHAYYETYRDPLNHKTILSGQVQDIQTGNYGQAYHVVTFTNDLFGTDNLIFSKATGESTTLSGENALSSLADRAVIDGIVIKDGMANGTENQDKGGGAAVVTEFAHVRNCVLQDNEATFYGGALFLQPGALVSGCVMLNNEAEYGGAVYVEETDFVKSLGDDYDARNPYYARLYNTTIVRNNASVRGGGLWYETNLRAKGVCLWWNSSNDMNNVAGVFDTEKLLTEQNYPFAYCAVQSRRLPGVNNIELQPSSEHGTRWTTNSIGDLRWRGDKPDYSSQTEKDAYYYIERLSVLVRSGMPYNLYKELRTSYPSLELRDMAGVARMKEIYDEPDNTTINYLKHMTMTPVAKDNDFIEIGARAINQKAGFVMDRPFTRLFVANPQYVDNDKASRLMACDDPLYSQQGSSMANPFQKFNDALDYIVELRNSDHVTTNGKTLAEIYKDTRFEIYVAGGTYYPYHNALGVEGHARSSTFVIPEGVTVVGGMDPGVYYCQNGYNFERLQPLAGDDKLNHFGDDTDDYRTNARTKILDAGNTQILTDIELKKETTLDIWEERPYADINGNSVFEPWEFLYQSTFSGETPRGVDNTDNVYHVFTCFADPDHVGTLPGIYTDNALSTTSGDTESPVSEFHRMIIFNGVNVTNGNARDYDSNAIKNLQQHYRGGGIMVDGNWTDGSKDSDQEHAYSPGARDIPMMIVSSQFQNNNAVQGGAIFTNGSLTIFSSSFAQNYAQGPLNNTTQTPEDKAAAEDVIRFCGGGAIATYGTLRCTNSIFANNEAMLGDYSLKEPEGTEKYGYLRQGFGGAIWGGRTSNVRLINCNVVNNQAVSYPAVYVNPSQDADRFCANTIFWGNKTTGITATGFPTITDINRDVFSYRSEEDKEAELALEEKEKAGTITNEERTQLENYRKIQPMYFCAYRPTFGPKPVMTTQNIPSGKVTINAGDFSDQDPTLDVTNFYGRNVTGEYDPHEVPFLGEKVTYFDVFKGNNNINITPENEGVNGPNFVLPSSLPGKEGYNPSANWMPARINNLTDNGWSYLTLTTYTASGDIEFKHVGTTTEDDTNTTGQKPEDVMPDEKAAGGPYNFYAYQLKAMYNLTFMPRGDQHYMRYKNTNMTDAVTNGESNMLRISSNPLTFEEAKAYIDLGVYEYQHRNLRINQSSEVDLLWVSATENLEKGNDGYSWETPTSNLQAAIETLMKSRNDHAKQINIIAGEYKPAAVLGDNQDRSLSFTIQTRPYNNGAFTPLTGKDYGVKSLTLRGGYDPVIPEELGYDFTKNKVTLSVEELTSASADQLNHIVNILDVEQYSTTVSETDGKPSSVSRGRAIPITFEGITFNNVLAGEHNATTNKGGAAIYYHQQKKYDDALKTKGDDPLEPPALCKAETTTVHNDETGEDEEVTNWKWEWDPYWVSSWNNELARQPKLTIRNCTFTQNGKEVTDPTSAVLIEGGGGESLVVNSLFEHNAGDPLVAVNTNVVNSTFGLNGGHLKLTEAAENGTQYHSQLHNSVIWHDDLNNGTPTATAPLTQFEVPTTMYNAGNASTSMTYNAITGFAVADDSQHNYGLSDIYNDVMEGPNFTDPDNGDFSLKPSKKLMNTGDNATYAQFVWPQPEYAAETEYKKLMKNEHTDQRTPITRTTIVRVGSTEKSITYTILKATNDNDLGFADRLIGEKIDRGAFECTSSGQRVLYVDMTKTPIGTETGKDWEKAYGPGQLQKAIDAATIYASNGSKKAYVFIKGQAGTSLEEMLTIRDGVDVYGSLQNSATIHAIPSEDTGGELVYTDQEIDAFINHVKAERRGIGAKNTNMTRVRGVKSVDGTYTQGAVIDGLVVTNNTTADEPVVDITIPNVALRNSIVRDNTMESGLPVINIVGGSGSNENALLYNTLVYDNTTTDAPVVNVEQNGYVLNTTIVSANDEEPIGGTANNSTHVQNIIAVKENTSERAATFAPYLRPDDKGGNTAYSLGNESSAFYLVNHQPYWYQLHELSPNINAGLDDGATPKDGGNTVAALFPDFVNFDHDRDILGNPRRLGEKVDNGCFETWKVAKHVFATNASNAKPELEKYVAEVAVNDPSYDAELMVPEGDYWTDNYGGHRYPHAGSVVYVENGGVLSFDQAETTHSGSPVPPASGGTPLFNGTEAIRPGYLLVKEGGSVYGNGNILQVPYVAVERTLSDTQYALVSTPFRTDIQNVYTTSYDDTTDELTQTNVSSQLTAYDYDSEERANYRYSPVSSDSELWKTRSSSVVDANEGWLLDWGSQQTRTVRLTSWGETSGSYVYTEDGTDKTVQLQQHDNRESAKDPAQFTTQENMGWNLKGLPWLISGYKTGGTNPNFEMDVPHMLYLMSGSGSYAPLASWTSEATVSVGDAFFTQTAIIGSEETLTFRQPYFTEATEAPVKGNQMTIDFWNEEGENDAMALTPTEDTDDAMAFTMNVDAVKWGALNTQLPQLWVENQGGTPFALSGHTPTRRRLPLGVAAPTEGTYTFQLRDNNDAEMSVWLIDKTSNKVVDLTEENYSFNGTSEATGRFYIQLGGTRPQLGDLPAGHQYKVYVRDRVLHVLGTQVGDQILVYLPDGALYVSDEAVDDHWRTSLQRQGIYVVRINNDVYKVIAR